MIDVLSNVFYFKKTCTPGNKFIQSLTISDYIYLNPPELDISIKKVTCPCCYSWIKI